MLAHGLQRWPVTAGLAHGKETPVTSLDLKVFLALFPALFLQDIFGNCNSKKACLRPSVTRLAWLVGTDPSSEGPWAAMFQLSVLFCLLPVAVISDLQVIEFIALVFSFPITSTS